MTRNWIEVVTGSLDDKKKYREYKARKAALPAPYEQTVDAIERYLNYAGAITKGDVLVAMYEDLIVLFEQAAADGTPVSGVVGDDPVEFVEDFLRGYEDGRWVAKERARLTESVAAAVRAQSQEHGDGD
ncbi:DUF1048 domain-containing protein [Demequina sp. NBRC 110056]|uniref:DUF1048 domain-containing protein n=1 Tax=Demequina sp. NBRC 110056 TaxID=1570345 RepID=UPI0009FE2174|nr:DUF1048 domain-containing protein [Demequina sp. NBRC 110056]